MNNRLTLEWRELENGNSELYLISDELEINCTELVREHYYFEDDEEVSFDRDNTSILNLTINGKRYIQLFDGSNYTIIDERGKITFDHLEYLEFNHDSTYFTSRNSNSEEYHLYSLSNSEPEFTSEFGINYDSVFDIFHIENEFGNHEVIYRGERYNYRSIIGDDPYPFKSKIIEIILTPIDDLEEGSILLISSPKQLSKKHFLERYSIIPSYNYEWIIINQFGEQFEIILGDGNCIRLEKNLSIATFSLGREELIFEIRNKLNNERFLIYNEFKKLLEANINFISQELISEPHSLFYLPAQDYFIIENKVIGDFLIILNESKNSNYKVATIYWDSETIWRFDVPIEQTKDPLLCLQYALIEQSNLRNTST
jgi:hypothetical protein